MGEELPPDSTLETEMANFVAKYRLPPVVFHPIVAGYEVDFLVVDTTVVIECDGWATHGLQRDQNPSEWRRGYATCWSDSLRT